MVRKVPTAKKPKEIKKIPQSLQKKFKMMQAMKKIKAAFGKKTSRRRGR